MIERQNSGRSDLVYSTLRYRRISVSSLGLRGVFLQSADGSGPNTAQTCRTFLN